MRRSVNANLTVAEHPAVADRLARLRERSTPTYVFRHLVEELGQYLAYEATRDLPTRTERVTTPLEETDVRRIGTRPVVAPILRAGLGLLPGFLAVIDDAVVAHLGFYRDPDTLAAIPYYANLPDDLAGRPVFLLDPMLATGHSGSAALGALATRGAANMTFICIIAAPEGVEEVVRTQPTCRIVTAALDRRLNDHGYIVPGLGDAGDRMFGSTSSVPTMVRAPSGDHAKT
ncbi:MAG: uracil phosphoribosyltransferase [Candidatus Eremiobacteraeota bacterium]|nr:uracil phosphoribosyltransferase [Candidatus Eremiobacteraeota bacterium]